VGGVQRTQPQDEPPLKHGGGDGEASGCNSTRGRGRALPAGVYAGAGLALVQRHSGGGRHSPSSPQNAGKDGAPPGELADAAGGLRARTTSDTLSPRGVVR